MAFGLGSNLGDSQALLLFGYRELGRILGSPRLSSPYRTAAQEEPEQPDFLNAAVVGLCDLRAEELLGIAKAIEQAAGRRPAPRYGPRLLDIDLLLVGGEVIDRPDLKIPHPKLTQRRFALLPLAEIAAELKIPPAGETVASCLQRLGAGQRAERLQWRRTSELS